ncbi:MAG TPA: hypothetical protein VEC11_15005 [Allosphingosinicella sp.]|nr:hypothetical protein [Allosphingosinicella sp.]
MTPEGKRARARRIRECALGFEDEISRTMIELAETLEVAAAQQEAAEADARAQRNQSGKQRSA